MELNSQQQAAVEYDGGHVLVLAGAGTGKTRTIIARAAHLIELETSPDRILLLTFTRRAAREMMERLYQMIGESSLGVMAGTFHHFCLYTMRRMARTFGIESATVIDHADQVQLMGLIRGEFKEKGKPFPKADELLRVHSYARNTTQPVQEYLRNYSDYPEELQKTIQKVFQEYDKRKQENRYLDYDDILFRFAEILAADKDVRDRIRSYYDHILVDEMQDTNPLQWQILDLLRDPAKLFCVGDDAQSIYAFRGADFNNIHSFTNRVPGSTVFRLELNYRSAQGILDISNWLLDCSPLPYGKKLRAHRDIHCMPKLYEFSSEYDEGKWIAEDLLKRHETGAKWSDHMIITRTGYGGRAVESYLVENHIPYQFIGGVSLLQAAHVKDLLCMIRAAASHHDELAWARFLILWPRIGDATAAKYIRGMREHETVEDAIGWLESTLKNRKDILKGIRGVLRDWTNPPKAIENAGEFLEPIMKTKYDDWNIRKQDWKLLAKLSQDHRSLMGFVETYTLDPISQTMANPGDEQDIVTLTTVHGAKGTEAPVCYLIRVEPGMYPHFRSETPEQQEEERRILYVAMTRAKDELIITRSMRYFQSQKPSWMFSSSSGRLDGHYFLRNLPDHLATTQFVFSSGKPKFPSFRRFKQ